MSERVQPFPHPLFVFLFFHSFTSPNSTASSSLSASLTAMTAATASASSSSPQHVGGGQCELSLQRCHLAFKGCHVCGSVSWRIAVCGSLSPSAGGDSGGVGGVDGGAVAGVAAKDAQSCSAERWATRQCSRREESTAVVARASSGEGAAQLLERRHRE